MAMIIDFDSHLREGYFMDEVYKLEGPYERFRPVKLNDGRTHNTKFLHSLDPISPQGHAAHRHPYIYDPKTNWRGGDVAARQVGGYDMARRREDIRKEGIDKQLIFPTQITVATSNIGGPGRTCSGARPTAARRWWHSFWAACSRSFRSSKWCSSNAAPSGSSTGCTAWTTTGSGPGTSRRSRACSRWRPPSTYAATVT